MEFRVLGPLEVISNGVRVPLGGARPRTALALLILYPNVVVSSARLIDSIWPAHPPATAANTLQVHMRALRMALDPDRAVRSSGALIVTEANGYRLRVRPGELDAELFEHDVSDARAAIAEGQLQRGVERIDAALELWRGEALGELADEDFARLPVQRWSELRKVAAEERFDAMLTLGEAAELIADLEAAVREEPWRERRAGQLMTALYRAGRQADALAAARRIRRMLDEELGVQPGPEIRELEQRILHHDPHLRSPRPPVVVLGRRTARVPSPGSPLIGRAADVLTVVELLRGHPGRVVTVTGAGGVGKTRVAVEAANQVTEDYTERLFVRLDDCRTSAEAITAILDAVRLSIDPDSDWLDAIADVVAGRHVLLVIDNAEQVAGIGAELARFASQCAGVQLLVTSRMPLRIAAEVDVALGPLALDAGPGGSRSPAVELFLERLRSAGRRTEVPPAAAEEICRRLDGLPLAIELAAARMRHLDADELVGRLNRSLSVLDRGSVDGPTRHRSLDAMVDWSYGLLSASAARLFRQVSVFSAPFTLAAAEAVCGSDLPAALILDDMADLVDANLLSTVIVAGRRRFVLLETMKAFAASRLTDDPAHADLRVRHCLHFLDELPDITVDPRGTRLTGEDYDRIDAEFADVSAAIRYGVTSGRGAEVARRVATLGRYLRARGRTKEAEGWYDALLDTDLPALERLWVTNIAGQVAYWRQSGRALPLLAQTVELADRLHERQLSVTARTFVAAALCDDDDLDQAGLALAEAEGIVDESDTYAMRQLSSMQGYLADRRGDFPTAIAHFESCLTLSRALGDPLLTCHALVDLVEVGAERGDYAEAAHRGEEALRSAQKLGDLSIERTARQALAWVHMGLGDGSAAAPFAVKSAVTSLQLDEGNLRDSVRSVAAVAVLLESPEAAAWLTGAADELRGTASTDPLVALTQVVLDRGRTLVAAATYDRAYEAGRAATADDVVRRVLEVGDSARR